MIIGPLTGVVALWRPLFNHYPVGSGIPELGGEAGGGEIDGERGQNRWRVDLIQIHNDAKTHDQTTSSHAI